MNINECILFKSKSPKRTLYKYVRKTQFKTKMLIKNDAVRNNGVRNTTEESRKK